MESGLQQRGARLDLLKGEADRIVLAVAAAANAGRVFWTRRYERAAAALDDKVKAALRERGVEGVSVGGRLLREPNELQNAEGRPAGTFSAFWRRHLGHRPLPPPSPAPDRLVASPWPAGAPARTTVAALRLTPTAPDWSGELALGETPGEDGGREALRRFVVEALPAYADVRDGLGANATSRLSAHLRFGEISARRAMQAVETAAAADSGLAAAPRNISRN